MRGFLMVFFRLDEETGKANQCVELGKGRQNALVCCNLAIFGEFHRPNPTALTMTKDSLFPALEEPGWSEALTPLLIQPEMQALGRRLAQRAAQGEEIFPSKCHWFEAFAKAPLDQVRVVILGQDPYPTPGQAHGLSFSVRSHVHPLPRSLVNIYTELNDDLGIQNHSGCLLPWARQGVLLLNAVLTVTRGEPGSHRGLGWEALTDTVIEVLNQRRRGIAFLLWGGYAHKKGRTIDRDRHFVLESAHPSPLSAYRGFFGSRPFSQVNQFLEASNDRAIDWQL